MLSRRTCIKKAASRLEICNDGWNWSDGGPVEDAKKFIKQDLRGESLQKALKEHFLELNRLHLLA